MCLWHLSRCGRNFLCRCASTNKWMVESTHDAVDLTFPTTMMWPGSGRNGLTLSRVLNTFPFPTCVFKVGELWISEGRHRQRGTPTFFKGSYDKEETGQQTAALGLSCSSRAPTLLKRKCGQGWVLAENTFRVILFSPVSGGPDHRKQWDDWCSKPRTNIWRENTHYGPSGLALFGGFSHGYANVHRKSTSHLKALLSSPGYSEP